MHTQFLHPHPALQPYVQNYVFFETGVTDQWLKADTSPTALPLISILLDDDNLSFKEYGTHESLVFAGQLTRNARMTWYGKIKMFYIFFQPTGAYQLLGLPMGEMKNKLFNLSDLLGPEIKMLKEKLTEQTSVLDVKQVVEHFLLQRIQHQKNNCTVVQLAHAIDHIRKHSHQKNVIKNICREHGYSISRLERHTREMVGIGPKMIQRIARFNSLLEHLIKSHPPYRWAQLALQFGFFDQMHLIKEFAWFYGANPSQLDQLSSKLQMSLNFFEETDSAKSILRVYK